VIRFLIRRLLAAIPVLFGLLLFTFLVIRLIPGGPFDNVGGKALAPAVRAALEARYGLNKPLFLNLPEDGSAPDAYYVPSLPALLKNLRTQQLNTPLISTDVDLPFVKLPNCEKLRSGASIVQAATKTDSVTVTGWRLLYLFEEHRQASYIQTVNGKTTEIICDDVHTVLYSDLTRSQFFEYLNNILRFDFGPSLALNTRGQSVSDIITRQLPVSAKLGLMGVFFGFLGGIPIGVLMALYVRTPIDRGISFTSIVALSAPSFVLGHGLILLFVNQLHWFPSPRPQPWLAPNPFAPDVLVYAVLPVFSLALGMVAGIARLTRDSLLQVLNDDYIRTARSKGLRERRILYFHALKNAMIPIATIVGPLLATTLVGTLFVEQIFAIPGLGSKFVDSVTSYDYNMLLAITLLLGTFLILGNILVDLMYTWLDPRIRFD
jgi:ABC-type dipeptide/oligopeptide/nickel transport system permease component